MPPRTYDPIYDNPLGPMSGRVTDPSDPGFLGPFPHPNSSRVEPGVADADTVSALNTLFGEQVDQSDDHHTGHDHHGHAHESLVNEHDQSHNLAPTLASHDVMSTQDQGQKDSNGDASLIIDPALSHSVQDVDSNDPTMHSPASAGANANGSVKRKATSRANMLARGGACEFCKRRKLKCSAEVPTCANCIKVGRECVYAQKKQRSRVRVLEDRLQELEKRLDNQNHSPPSGHVSGPDSSAGAGHGTGSTTLQDPGTSSTATLGNTPGENEPFYDGFTLSTFDVDGLGLSPVKHLFNHEHEHEHNQEQGTEPDVLMTLADAAAGDTNAERQAQTELRALNGQAHAHAHAQNDRSEPWDGLEPEKVVIEILKAVAGGKGVGEKIVAHLLQLYMGPATFRLIHTAVSPASLMSRLSSKPTRPIHPTLLLSLMTYMSPKSPSPALSHPSIPSLLLQHARTHLQHAVVNADARILDLTMASIIRGYWLINEARYFEGWTEIAQSTGLIYATGLSKLGHVGEAFVMGMDIPGRKERVEKESKLKEIVKKGQIVPPAQSAAELGERINLFWFAYSCDRCTSIGWGSPSSYSDEEITTPWPKDDYESTESLLDNRTVLDFMTSTTVDDASKDSTFCAQVKSVTLLYHAKRLFDTLPSVASPEKTARLMRITQGYMSTLPPLKQSRYMEGLLIFGQRVTTWVFLHGAMALMHAKEYVDASTEMEIVHLDRCLDSVGKMLEVLDEAQRCGDVELESCDLKVTLPLGALGNTVFKIARRLLLSPNPQVGDEARLLLDLESKKENILRVLNIMGKRIRFSAMGAQLLSNMALGTEFKYGEFERPDNVE